MKNRGIPYRFEKKGETGEKQIYFIEGLNVIIRTVGTF